MKPRQFFRLLLFAAAVFLIVVGRLALWQNVWLDWLLGLVDLRGNPLWELYPGVVGAGSVFSLGVVVLGCLLAASALDAPSPGADARGTESGPVVRKSTRLAVASFVTAAAICGVAAALLHRPEPKAAGAVLWCVSLLLSGIAAWLLDRARGTSFGNPLPLRADWIAVLTLLAVDLVVVGHDVGHWAWAGTPDEGNFFPFALEISEGRSSRFILDEAGMYNVHPLLSSWFQAAFMRFFGNDAFGWRLSSAFALAGSLPFVYLIGRELWSRRFGIWAAVLFGTSPLAVGFAHFGYNNSQVYLFVTGSLAAFLWARRRRSALGYWLSGAIAGLAVFTFYPARIAGPLVVLLALCVGERPWRAAVRSLWIPLILGALIAATPCLVHPVDTLGRMFGQTSFKPAEDVAPTSFAHRVGLAIAGKGVRLAQHMGVSLLHPIWYPRPSHFQSTAVIDPLQGALAVTGFFLAWRGFRRRGGCRFLALGTMFAALTVGSVSQHDCPPLTRLMFLCPFTAMLAALALEQLLAPLRGLVRMPRASTFAGGVVVAASALWGLGILRTNIYVRNHGYGEGTTSEVIRLAQGTPDDWRVIYVQNVPTYMQGVDNFAMAYGFKDRVDYLRLSEEILKHMPGPDARHVLIAHDLPDGEPRRALEGGLLERFPGRQWRDTAPGEKWNLHVLAVGDQGDGGWQPPPLPDESEARRILLGHTSS